MQPVTGPIEVANSGSPLPAKQRALAVLVGVAAATALAACDPPLNLGQPSTRALENGASGGLTTANSFEIAGSYSESGESWLIDLQVVKPATQHLVVTKGDLKLEAIVFTDPAGLKVAYFRGNQFLSQHMGNDLASRNLVRAAGNAWWKGSADQVPQLPDFTNGTGFRATFLGTALSQRTDHVTVDGVDAVNLSGPRADVFVAAASPYQLLRVHMKKGSAIDGLSDADFTFSNFDQDFKIAAPTDVIDFSNLSTLPPIYTVLSVDTSKCVSPCIVSATLKNLGGKLNAKAPSTINFAMVDAATKLTVGSCSVQVKPDVGYNATTKVSCTMSAVNGEQVNAATVTATPDNPGHS
jgi:hypothetical protein